MSLPAKLFNGVLKIGAALSDPFQRRQMRRAFFDKSFTSVSFLCSLAGFLFLAILLIEIGKRGLPTFSQVFAQKLSFSASAEQIEEEDYFTALQDSLRAQFPQWSVARATSAIDLLSENAEWALIDKIENPNAQSDFSVSARLQALFKASKKGLTLEDSARGERAPRALTG